MENAKERERERDIERMPKSDNEKMLEKEEKAVRDGKRVIEAVRKCTKVWERNTM